VVLRGYTVGVCIVVGNGFLLALEDTGGHAVVVGDADVELMADGIDGRGLPDRAAAVAPLCATVIRYEEGFPTDTASAGVERHDAAAEGATGILGKDGEAFLSRRDSDVNSIAQHYRGAGDLGGDMAVHAGDPTQAPVLRSTAMMLASSREGILVSMSPRITSSPWMTALVREMEPANAL